MNDYTFQTEAEGTLAANALLDQAVIGGPEGLFNSNPTLINGHDLPLVPGSYYTATPFGIAPGGTMAVDVAYNFASGDNFVWVVETLTPTRAPVETNSALAV